MQSVRWSRFSLIWSMFLVLSMVVTPLAAQAQHQARSLDAANMDFSVDPAEDFYRFVNGGWLDRTEIPAHEGAYSVFTELANLTEDQLLVLLEEAESGGELVEGSDQWKAIELYTQGNDIATRNAQGIEPIRPILAEIDAIGTLDDLHAFHRTAGFSMLGGVFSVGVEADLADSSVNVPYLSGPFLGLPNSEYYLDDTEENAVIREAYIQAGAELLMYASYDEAEALEAATAVYQLERSMAAVLLTREEQQDVAVIYNPMTVAELQEAYPLMDWAAYVAALGLTDSDVFIVTEPAYIESLQGIVEATPLAVLKDYYTLELFWTFAGVLSEDVGKTAFAFRGGVLGGVTEQRPLEVRTLDQVNDMVPDAIGQLYVASYFPPEAKAEIEALVDAEIAAFRIRIENNPWMSDETRALALKKLDAVQVKVGYPDQWETYEDIEVGDSFAASMLSVTQAATRDNLADAGEPVDRDAWDISVQTVNAYYNPLLNEIVFPAAILQAPYFEYGGDPAANFGGIGMVIGHELTHGFDLTGSQFDAEGNLVNWWAEEDFASFNELNQRVVEQYNAVEVLPGVFVNGQVTVTENVADLGGTQIAYDALMLYLAGEGQLASPVAQPVAATPMASPVMAQDVGSLTPPQRFFVAATTVWRVKTRDEALRTQVMVDTHSPGSVRAVLPLQHMDAFHEAFGIQPGDAMYLAPEDRIVIW